MSIPNRYEKWAICALCALSVLYLLQMFSPLRLTTDSIVYLQVARSAADGQGFLFHGESTHYPPGYPALIALLIKSGQAASWSFIGLNCLFVALGLLACFVIFRQTFKLSLWVTLLLCCLTLLNWVFIKHMPLLLSDIPYFGVSLATMALLVLAEESSAAPRKVIVALALLLMIFAIALRAIGIALLPSFLWFIFRNYTFRRNHTVLVLIIMAGLLAASAFFIGQSDYFQEAWSVYARRWKRAKSCHPSLTIA